MCGVVDAVNHWQKNKFKKIGKKLVKDVGTWWLLSIHF